MAETKKKTTSKSTTTSKKSTGAKSAGKKAATKQTDVPVTETVMETTVIDEPVNIFEPVMEKRIYQATDMIPCKSVRYGVLQHVSKKSGDMYEWADYGDIVDVAYGDLLALKSRKSKFMFAPWFLILDDQLVDEWTLTDIYSYYEDFDDIEEFLNEGVISLRRKLPNAPQGFKELVVHKAGDMLRNGTLDSIATVKAIDEILNKNLSDMLGGR